jgi:hypothetical protein
MNLLCGPHVEEQKGADIQSGGLYRSLRDCRHRRLLASPAARSVTGAAWTVDNRANA